jgi:hypothetical protein
MLTMRRMRYLAAALVVISTARPALATVTVSIANAATTGTTVGSIAKLTTSGSNSTAVIAATTDTGGVIGVVVSGGGTSGNALIAIDGIASCTFDASGVTAGHYVQISSTTSGACKDGGASYPNSGQVLGIALQTVASGAANIVVFPPGNMPTVNSGASTSGANVWTGQNSSPPCPLTDAATITVSATACAASPAGGVAFQTLTLGGNRTLGNPSGLVAGQVITFRITQDGTGSRALSYSSDYKFAGGPPTLTATAGAVDEITCWAAATSELDCVAALNVH